MKIVSRADARAAGEPRYRIGLPCPKDHHAERWTRNALCVVCHPVLRKPQKTPRWKRQEKRQVQWTRRERERRATDPAYKFVCAMRSRMAAALKSKGKSTSTIALLGCDPVWFIAKVVPTLLAAASAKYGLDLTLENHGKVWHWDHHLPIASFDHSNPEQQRIAWRWDNLRPLPASVNLSKKDRLPTE